MAHLKKWICCLVCGLAFLFVGCGSKGTKIAFIVKDINEAWFQNEIEYAQKAAVDFGFKLYVYPLDFFGKTALYTHENFMTDLADARSKGCQGVIACVPDVSRGDEIVEYCIKNNMKLMTVDDRFRDSSSWSGFNEDVPHLGIDGYQIGRLVGITSAQELIIRGWSVSRTGIIELKSRQNPILAERVEGASLIIREVLPFKDDNFFSFDVPVSTYDNVNQLLKKHFPAIRNKFENWIIFSQNDDCTLGGVHALGELGLVPRKIIGCGINGSPSAIADLKLASSTGFMGSVKLQVNVHGYDTCKNMYRWIVKGIEPEKLTTSDGVLLTRDDFQDEVVDRK